MSDHPEDQAPNESAAHRQPGALTAAMQNADTKLGGEAAVGKALTDDPKAVAPQPYKGHSHATEAIVAAQQLLLRERLADIDERIATLNDERQDIVDALDTMTESRTKLKERQAKRVRR